jgi:hypothetical protein
VVGLVTVIRVEARHQRAAEAAASEQMRMRVTAQNRIRERLAELQESARKAVARQELQAIALERISLETQARGMAMQPLDLQRGVDHARWERWLRSFTPMAPLLIAGLLLFFGAGSKWIQGRQWFVVAVSVACAVWLWVVLHPDVLVKGLDAAMGVSRRTGPSLAEEHQVQAAPAPLQAVPQPSHP